MEGKTTSVVWISSEALVIFLSTTFWSRLWALCSSGSWWTLVSWCQHWSWYDFGLWSWSDLPCSFIHFEKLLSFTRTILIFAAVNMQPVSSVLNSRVLKVTLC